jgi:large subunit ribosomal protein L25
MCLLLMAARPPNRRSSHFLQTWYISFTMVIQLKAQKRDKKGTKHSVKLREDGRVPAVVYGKKETATAITLSEKEFQKALEDAGESTVLELVGVGETKDVLIHDIDRDPVRGTVRHVDFYAIEKGKPVEVSVPIEFTGVSPAEKELGGSLMKVMHEVEIEALPKDLPHEVILDISILKTFEDQAHASDIMLPAGVTLKTDPDEVIALVTEAKEEEEEPTEVPDLSSIEVEKKGKAESEEEGDGEKNEKGEKPDKDK